MRELRFQETKVTEEKLPEEMKNVEDYPHSYWLAAQKDGYSGVGKKLLLNVVSSLTLILL